MGRQVRAKSGVRGVALPDGSVLSAAGPVTTTTLTDAQYSGLSARVLAQLDDLGPAPDPTAPGQPPADAAPTTASLRTLGTGSTQAAPGDHSHGTGGGSGATLGSAVPQPLGTAAAGSAATASREDHVHAGPPVDPAAGTAGLRTLGTGANQAASGTDARLSDQRVPTAGSVDDSKVVAGGLSPSSIAGTAVVTTDGRLSNARTPSGSAGGVLSGTYPNPSVVAGAITPAMLDRAYDAAGAATAAVAAIPSDGLAGVASLRTLGTGAVQAAAGNDGRLSDTRVPTDGSVSTPKIQDTAVTPAKLDRAYDAAGAAAAAVAAIPSNGAAATPSLRTLGTTGTSAAAGNDGRLSDARTPLAHAASHASGGSDAVTPGAIGALPLSGGTLTGSLLLAGSPAAALEAAPRQYVDAVPAFEFGFGAPSATGKPNGYGFLDRAVGDLYRSNGSAYTKIGSLFLPIGQVTGLQAALDAKYVKPGTGIPEADFDTATQGKIDAATVPAPFVHLIKSAGETRAVTTRTMDNTLFFTPDVNATYVFQLMLHLVGSTTGQFSAVLLGPSSGATVRGFVNALPLGATQVTAGISQVSVRAFNSVFSAGTPSASTPTVVIIAGTLKTGSTVDGPFGLSWGQNAVDATTVTNLFSGSELTASKTAG